MKRILVAIDSSSRAPAVLAAALRMAELSDAKLVVFRAIGIPPDMPPALFMATDLSLEDVLLRNARNELDLALKDVPRDRVEKIVIDVATPWDGICRAGREHDVDLIVLGSHGYRGLDKLLGTNAGKVVNHADRNVLVVRTPL
ncbi:hypothetical protein BH11MYX3_BH11MYX3_12010 [soil metagenome]